MRVKNERAFRRPFLTAARGTNWAPLARQPPYPRIEELAAQIRERGQTTPMFVRRVESSAYELISGYRRRAALEQLGFDTALVRVFVLDDEQAYHLAISENQDRDALSDLERALICARLQRSGLTVDQIAAKMGWTGQSNVQRHLRVSRLAPEPLQKALQAGTLTMAIANVFLDHLNSIPIETSKEILDHAAEHEMSAAEFRRYLQRVLRGPRAKLESEPLRPLKGGGFSLSGMRCEPSDVFRLDQQIEVLREALKRARVLRRDAEKAGQSPSDAAEA